MSRTIHRARWIMPVDSPPVENGCLVIEGGRIVAVERANIPSSGEVDHGDAVILPGWVNAHTHLELTPLAGRVPFRGSFVRWVEDLVARTPPERPDDGRIAAIRAGLSESLNAGVTAIGDIGLGPHASVAWSDAWPWITGYLEILGMGPRRFAAHGQSFDTLAAACDRCRPQAHLLLGLSPHAPYSVDPSVYRLAIEYASAGRRPLCTHLAETQDEQQFLADATGPLRDLLDRWGLWDGSFHPPGCSAVQYADRLGLLAAGAMLVHVNYASDADLDLIVRHGGHVAFCPRSHRFFGHAPHRFREMLQRGINVCIGTDSLASNDSLSVLDELRFLYREDASLLPHTLLRMGTLAGAKAIGFGSACGSLTAGKSADFVVLPIQAGSAGDAAAEVFSGDSRPLAVYLRGQRM